MLLLQLEEAQPEVIPSLRSLHAHGTHADHTQMAARSSASPKSGKPSASPKSGKPSSSPPSFFSHVIRIEADDEADGAARDGSGIGPRSSEIGPSSLEIGPRDDAPPIRADAASAYSSDSVVWLRAACTFMRLVPQWMANMEAAMATANVRLLEGEVSHHSVVRSPKLNSSREG